MATPKRNKPRTAGPTARTGHRVAPPPIDGSTLSAIGKLLSASRGGEHEGHDSDPLSTSLLDHLISDHPIDDVLPTKRRRALPASTRQVLSALHLLRDRPMSAEDIRQLQKNIRGIRDQIMQLLKVAEPSNDGFRQLPELLAQKRDDALSETLALLDKFLGAEARLVEACEDILRLCGFRRDPQTGRVECGSGGRPRQFLRNIVGVLVRDLKIAENTVENRHRVAAVLAPFFASSVVDVTKGSALYRAVDNVLHERWEKVRPSKPHAGTGRRAR